MITDLMPKKTDGRPSWDEYGLGLAEAVAQRADSTRRTVGAVLMRPDHTIVGTGYNGGPPGGLSCLKGQCPRGQASQTEVPGYDAPGVREGLVEASSYDLGPGSCIALHAEQNVLLRATWDEMHDATLYVTCEPCPGCARMITGTHVSRVVWRVANTDEREPETLWWKVAVIRNGRWLVDPTIHKDD